jgi:hypothetical protein
MMPQQVQNDADSVLQDKIKADCWKLEIPFRMDDPWGGLTETDLQRITCFGTYNEVEVKRMHLKCVGERMSSISPSSGVKRKVEESPTGRRNVPRICEANVHFECELSQIQLEAQLEADRVLQEKMIADCSKLEIPFSTKYRFLSPGQSHIEYLSHPHGGLIKVVHM